MSYAPGAPAAVWAIAGLDAGAKLTLLWLWSKADHAIQREPEPTTVWAPAREGMTPAESLRADIAEGTGATARSVRAHLGKLRAMGLAEASGRCVELTPPCQACRPSGKSDTAVADAKPASSDITAAEPDTAAARHDSLMSAQLNPPEPPNSSPPTPQSSAQSAFALEPDGPTDAELLRAEHDRLRREAQAEHGQRRTALPSPSSRSGKSLDRRMAVALGKHGLSTCRRILAWQAQRWRDDPGQLTWSTDSVWSPKSIQFALGRIREAKPSRVTPDNPDGFDIDMRRPNFSTDMAGMYDGRGGR